MPTIGFLFFSGPYQTEAPETLIELANAAVNKGHTVKIFCYMDAVSCVKTGQKKVPGVMNIEEPFKDLIEKGVEVRLCALCLLVRGTKDVVKGARRSGTPYIANMVEDSDRILVIA